MPAGANPSIRYKNKGAQIGRDAGIGWKLSSTSHWWEQYWEAKHYELKVSIFSRMFLRLPCLLAGNLTSDFSYPTHNVFQKSLLGSLENFPMPPLV